MSLRDVRRVRKTWVSIAAVASALLTQGCWALDVRFEPLAPNVYVYIGDKGARSIANEGLNANVGLVVTPTGAVLIDSGATFLSAAKIDAAVKNVTSQPVRWVINSGGQDHRWLGNGYFAGKGAEIIAHAAARADMQSRGGEQLAALRSLLGEAAANTIPTFPTRLVEAPDTRLELGGTVVELRHRGGAHTPGDIMVWLPKQRVLFTGDIVYVDRLLAVIPVSNTRQWLESFALIDDLRPHVIVPGHGGVTDPVAADAQTRAYLVALRAHMKRALDAGVDLTEAVKTFDGARFKHLLNAEELIAGNANRVYLEVERE